MIDSDDMDDSLQQDKDNNQIPQQQPRQQVYKIIRLLGRGAFGKAYLVQENKDSSLWVMKRVDIADMTQEERDQTTRQHLILESLDHPNIVKFKEIYRTDKMKLNIIMEYADGGDLAGKINEAKAQGNKYFDENTILGWFTQICLAIKHVHDRKIIHRDIKGQNVFLTSAGLVKLGDFGIARVLHKTLEKARTVIGTPYYLSPEIIENKPYSFKSDIWSLGVLLYEMCALTPPFTGNSIQFLALKIVKGSYSSIPSCYSSGLKGLVRAMLNIDPSKRPTIQDILKSGLIYNRITNYLTESQKQQQFSHTVLHKENILKPRFQGLNDQKSHELGSPPNLLKMQNNSKSSFYLEKDQHDSQLSSKIQIEEPKQNSEGGNSKQMFFFNKSPNIPNKVPPKPILGHKTPINGFYRPPSSHPAQRPIPAETPNLDDILNIKAPKLVQQMPKTPLPKIKTPEIYLQKKRPSTPNLNNLRKQPAPNQLGLGLGEVAIVQKLQPNIANKISSNQSAQRKSEKDVIISKQQLNFKKKPMIIDRTEQNKSKRPSVEKKTVYSDKPVKQNSSKIIPPPVEKKNNHNLIGPQPVVPAIPNHGQKKVTHIKKAVVKNKVQARQQLEIEVKFLGGGLPKQDVMSKQYADNQKKKGQLKSGAPKKTNKAVEKIAAPLEIKSEEVKKLEKIQRDKKKQKREEERKKMKEDILKRKQMLHQAVEVQEQTHEKARTAEEWRSAVEGETQEDFTNRNTWDIDNRFNSNQPTEAETTMNVGEFKDEQDIQQDINYQDQQFEDDQQCEGYNWDQAEENAEEPRQALIETVIEDHTMKQKNEEDIRKMRHYMEDIVGLVSQVNSRVNQLCYPADNENSVDFEEGLCQKCDGETDKLYESGLSLNYSMTAKNPLTVHTKEDLTLRLTSKEEQQQVLGLHCLQDHSKLEDLRIILEEVFGTQNFITIYRMLEEMVRQRGLNFDEEEMSRRMSEVVPEVKAQVIEKYFSLLATLVVLQNPSSPTTVN